MKPEKEKIIAFAAIIFASALVLVRISSATTPNPGHPWTDIGNGFWQVANTQTATRTYTFPDSDAEIWSSSSSITFLQRTITASTTLDPTTDAIVFVDATNATITVTLPSASGTNSGLFYIIKKIDSALTNIVTINPQANQTIDGLSSISFANRGEAAMFQSDGTNWNIVLRRDYEFDAYHTRGSSSNQFYTSPTTGIALSAGTPAANKIYAIPLIITKPTTIDMMAISVTTSNSTNSYQIGIYNDNGNNYPGALLVDAGSLSGAVTTTVTSTTGLPVDVDTGLYWLVIDAANAAGAVRGFAVGSMAPVLGYSSALPTASQFGWTATLTKGALPATFPTTASATISAIPIPAIFVRFSG